VTEDEAVVVLTRTLRSMPTATLRTMAESVTPTTAAVARVLLESRPEAEPHRNTIFPS